MSKLYFATRSQKYGTKFILGSIMFQIDPISIKQVPILTTLDTKSSPFWQALMQPWLNQYLLTDTQASHNVLPRYQQHYHNSDLSQPISANNTLVVREYYELVPWTESFEAMVQFTQQRNEYTLDQILLLQHQPVFTQGIAGKKEHLLAINQDIPVVQADRGGQVTYHGPRQQIIYLLIDFNRRKQYYEKFNYKFYARNIVTAMEEAVVNALTHLGIAQVHAKPDAPGIYVANKKISSLGLKVTKHGTYHGIAINLDMDLEPFHMINPCGYAGLEMCNITDYVNLTQVQQLLATAQLNLADQDLYQLLRTLVTNYFISYLAQSLGYDYILDAHSLLANHNS